LQQRESNKSVNIALHEIGRQGKVSLFMLVLLIGFAGKIDSLYKGRKTFIEQIFVIYRWNYALLAWKTWRQGRTHARIDGGRS